MARSLEPLYSLADFCYAVRREVLDVTGGADEEYGHAPCWEMDLNIRAARAAFSGLWVGGAYVYRSPLTARRAAAEESLLDAGKRRYQDRLCGLRLTGRTDQYRSHCDGDGCEHFAPREMIPSRAQRAEASPGLPPSTLTRQGVVRTAPGPVTARPTTVRDMADPPLVSCIMPTRNRPDFAVQAVRYFQRQDWPETELIIIEDGPPLLADLLPDDPRIKLVSSGIRRSIGQMRNHACALARGEIIAQWDDDDWHGPERLSRQVGPIVAERAEITALRDCVLFDVNTWKSWQWSADLHRRMLVRDVLGGTLVFRRQVWEKLARYPHRSLAEDAAFLDQAMRRRARLSALSAAGLYIYIRHNQNSWRLHCGQTVHAAGWQQVPEPAFPAADRAFYRQHSLVADPARIGDGDEVPRPNDVALSQTTGRPRETAQLPRGGTALLAVAGSPSLPIASHRRKNGTSID
jgi:hypothetical protein